MYMYLNWVQLARPFETTFVAKMSTIRIASPTVESVLFKAVAIFRIACNITGLSNGNRDALMVKLPSKSKLGRVIPISMTFDSLVHVAWLH